MLDKHTFGKTPAAIYLADRLNFLNDPKYTRKISVQVEQVSGVLSESIKAHEAGHLSLKTLNFITKRLHQKVTETSERMLAVEPYVGSGEQPIPDALSINLMTNMLIGKLKSISRRSREVRLLKHQQDRIVGAINNCPFPINESEQAFRSSCGLELVSTKEVLTIKKLTTKDVIDPVTAESLIERSRAKLKHKQKQNTLYADDRRSVHSCDIPGCAVCDPTYGL